MYWIIPASRALAIKRKSEAEREEKRRQQILAKRREKQQEATEKFQRSHFPSRPNSGSSNACKCQSVKVYRHMFTVWHQNNVWQILSRSERFSKIFLSTCELLDNMRQLTYWQYAWNDIRCCDKCRKACYVKWHCAWWRYIYSCFLSQQMSFQMV